jgi:LacI family gluconate utilization system Gnt-I transcriptional repressor
MFTLTQVKCFTRSLEFFNNRAILLKKTTNPTMGDVAKRAGVSQMTVSRVMSQNGYVSNDVCKRVQAAAQEVGYLQNRLAHGLRSEKTQLIAVVTPSLGNPVFTDTISAITDAVTAKGFRPIFGVTEYIQDKENELVRDLLTWRPFGIVLAGLEHSDDTRAAIKASGVRVAEIMDIDGVPMSLAFGFSHKKAGELTAKYMLERGHRRFAYIGSLGGLNIRAQKRLRGFVQTLKKAGAILISEDISPLSSSMVVGLKMTIEVLSRPDKPDAIYYANDDLASGGIMHCLVNNIKIPEELALAGFNGLPFLDAFPIQLTTIRTPRYQIGWQAGKFLVSADQESLEPRSTDFGFEFIHGETC